MLYYKNVTDGHLSSVEKRESHASGAEITESEYSEILSMLRNRPTAPDGYGYRLTESLEWELYELPPEEPKELTETEQ